MEESKFTRTLIWSEDVEEQFRLQQSGWCNLAEYKSVHGEPERWNNSFVKCLRTKKDAYYCYWSNERECEDRFLRHVKV